jgi:glycosyltransferase involved in cell wall biosynthesis
MKILQIHNTYQQRGGEDVVLAAEYDILRQHGHQVEQLVFSNDNIAGVANKLRTSLSSFYNPASARRLRERIEAYRPDVIHVHNFLYVASPAVFYAARRYNVPVVLTLHSYRLICAGFYLLRDGQVCELCVQRTFPIHGVVHACFKNSRLQSANYTLLTGVHKWLNTWTAKVDVLVTLTEFARNKLVHSSLRPDPARVVVKANSVPDYGVGTEPREDYFLFVGRLSPEKGIGTLLESLRTGWLSSGGATWKNRCSRPWPGTPT